MSAFIPIKTFHIGNVVDAFVNVDRVVMVWDADYRDDMEGQCFYSMTDGFSTEHAAEPYDSVVAKILAATVKEKIEKSPHTPLKDKRGDGSEHTDARTREEDLTCEGFLVPTLDEVKKHAATLGISDDTATDFWYLFDGQGWRTKSGAFIYNWRSLLTSFNRGRKRLEMGDAKRTAHIDAILEERERRSGGGRKKADNYIASTPEQVKEFTDGL